MIEITDNADNTEKTCKISITEITMNALSGALRNAIIQAADIVNANIQMLAEIEDDGDRIHRRITALLFNGSYPAMDVLRIVGVVDLFEDSLDDMARVARAVNSLNLHK